MRVGRPLISAGRGGVSLHHHSPERASGEASSAAELPDRGVFTTAATLNSFYKQPPSVVACDVEGSIPDMRLHDLRHSCATLLLAQGVNPRVVMETLGHSQV